MVTEYEKDLISTSLHNKPTQTYWIKHEVSQDSMDLSCPSLHSLLVCWQMILTVMLSSAIVVSHLMKGLPRILLMIMVKVQKKVKNAQALFEASAYVKFDSFLLALAKQIT